MKTSEIARGWHLIDAQGQTLGRLAVRVAVLLRGKNKPSFTPHIDGGDQVVVINADKIQVTGNKTVGKIYTRYSGYPGGLKKESVERLLVRRPTEVFRRAVTGMLPKNRLGSTAAKRLYIYTGPTHPHTAQLGGAPKKAEKAPKAETAKKAEAAAQ